jgi:hypothetical protein
MRRARNIARMNVSRSDENRKSIDPDQRNQTAAAASSTDFLLDDAERRRDVPRRIDDLAFMKKARLRCMRSSPTYCPLCLCFLTFLS